MTTVLLVLVVWVVASVPFALLIGYFFAESDAAWSAQAPARYPLPGVVSAGASRPAA